jgi:hypothetical protein
MSAELEAERRQQLIFASPRRAKRENSALEMTGVGTPSSIAACKVQRPSPESETRPENPARSGLLHALVFTEAQLRPPHLNHAASPASLMPYSDKHFNHPGLLRIPAARLCRLLSHLAFAFLTAGSLAPPRRPLGCDLARILGLLGLAFRDVRRLSQRSNALRV